MKASVVSEFTDALPTLLQRLTERRDALMSTGSSPKTEISSGFTIFLIRRGQTAVCALRQVRLAHSKVKHLFSPVKRSSLFFFIIGDKESLNIRH
jgi:hypothetical protein